MTAARQDGLDAVGKMHQRWQLRADSRRAAAAKADPAMAAAIADIGILDSEPGTQEDAAAAREAVGRLTALADRAPETFTTAVIDLAIQLIEKAGVTALLGPLRHLARRRAELAVPVLGAALISLDRGLHVIHDDRSDRILPFASYGHRALLLFFDVSIESTASQQRGNARGGLGRATARDLPVTRPGATLRECRPHRRCQVVG